MRRRQMFDGFTLVELLVVIAIIAVLIGILLPTLSKARDYANRVKCAANLHSIGHAMTMYTQRYGCYPAAYGGDGGIGAYAIWPTRLRTFLGGNHDVFLCPSRDATFRWPRPGDPTPPGQHAYRATSVQTRFGYEIGEWLMASSDRFFFSYGYNVWGWDSGGANIGEPDRGLGDFVVTSPSGYSAKELPANRVKVASDVIAIADSNGDGIGDTTIQPSNPLAYPGVVHGGGANFLFCDGHVTWRLQKDMAALPVPEGQLVAGMYAARARLWNNDNKVP